MPRRPTRLYVARSSADPQFYSALDEARARGGLSGRELARRAQVDYSTTREVMGRYVRRGRVRACWLDVALRLAAALDAPLETFFERATAADARSQQYAQALRSLEQTAPPPDSPAGKLLQLLRTLTADEVRLGHFHFLKLADAKDLPAER